MHITRQSDYAIRCILYLASNSDGRSIMIEEIAGAMNIPKSFLAKILQKLSKAGIVGSVRGVKGGFLLNKKISEITLLDVISCIDGPISVSKCAVNKDYCRRNCFCAVHPIWINLREMIGDYLKAVTFEKLADKKPSWGPKKNQ